MARRNLKIAIICIHTSPLGDAGIKDTGGMNVYVRELARELGKRELHVDVYTRAAAPGYENLVARPGPNFRLVHLRAGEPGCLDKLDLYDYLPEFAANLENFAAVHKLRYDLVFSHYWLSGMAASCLSGSWSVPHVVMFHTLGAVKNSSGAGYKEPELRIQSERFLAGNCEAVIVSTAREKDELGKYCGDPPTRIITIPCGVNTGRFQIMDKEAARRALGFRGGKIVLAVGRIDPIKGLDRLISAMSYLKSGPRATLLIIGDENNPGEIKRLERLSRDLGLEESVIFWGLVKHEDLPCFYNAADVCAVVSYSESFGMTALESLACGTPVLAADVGSLKNIIRQGETGYVVDNPTPYRISQKLSMLLSNPSGFSASAIRKSVYGYSWNHIAGAIEEEFTRLVEGK